MMATCKREALSPEPLPSAFPFGANDNCHAYVGNDPVNFIDPSGMTAEDDDDLYGDQEIVVTARRIPTVTAGPTNAAWRAAALLTSPPTGGRLGVGDAATAEQEIVVTGERSEPTRSDDQTIVVRAQRILPRLGPPPSGFFARPPVIPRPPFPYPGRNTTRPPSPDFQWRGRPGSNPGDPGGSWYNPRTGEYLRPDLNHRAPIRPHWDYRAPDGSLWRWFGRGDWELKSMGLVA